MAHSSNVTNRKGNQCPKGARKFSRRADPYIDFPEWLACIGRFVFYLKSDFIIKKTKMHVPGHTALKAIGIGAPKSHVMPDNR